MKPSDIVGLDPSTRLSNMRMVPVQIDGSALTTTSSSAGVLTGASLVSAKDDGGNTVTLAFSPALRNAPMVLAQAKGTNTTVENVVSSTGSVTYDTVQDADGSTAVNDADVDLILIWFDDADVI